MGRSLRLATVLLIGLASTRCHGLTVPAADFKQETNPATTSAAGPARSAIEYTTHDLGQSLVHVVTVPPESPHQLAVAVTDDLGVLPDIAQAAGAIAAINGGFFDPQNGLTTAYVIVDGQVVADPAQNPRLMENLDLVPYLDAILNRSEFRIYTCGETVAYAIAQRMQAVPPGCTLDSAVGGGPQLLPRDTGYEEGFLADDGQGTLIRDAVGSRYPNARSAVGLKADGTVVFAMAAQRPGQADAAGLTLTEFAVFLEAQLGVTSALNLDGGSSSGLVYRGEGIFGHLDENDRPIRRPIKSILWVR